MDFQGDNSLSILQIQRIIANIQAQVEGAIPRDLHDGVTHPEFNVSTTTERAIPHYLCETYDHPSHVSQHHHQYPQHSLSPYGDSSSGSYIEDALSRFISRIEKSSAMAEDLKQRIDEHVARHDNILQSHGAIIRKLENHESSCVHHATESESYLEEVLSRFISKTEEYMSRTDEHLARHDEMLQSQGVMLRRLEHNVGLCAQLLIRQIEEEYQHATETTLIEQPGEIAPTSEQNFFYPIEEVDVIDDDARGLEIEDTPSFMKCPSEREELLGDMSLKEVYGDVEHDEKGCSMVFLPEQQVPYEDKPYILFPVERRPHWRDSFFILRDHAFNIVERQGNHDTLKLQSGRMKPYLDGYPPTDGYKYYHVDYG